MNFLSFRDQVYDWTLDTDQNLFSQVNQLTDYIFQTQQNITQSIAITRSTLNDSSTILNNNFNHYLRLSETKFTQNKIAQPKKINDQNSKKEDVAIEPKSKMDIFKQALNISLKNLEIKEQEKQTDNVSISQLSLSQAIFKNARLPPYFGSKEFRAQKFLNLFFDEDLGSEILSKKQIQSMSNKPLSTPSQENSLTNLGSNNINLSSGYLPPPPSLQSLNLLNNGYQTPSGTLPIPPLLNLLPPPPLPPGLTPPPLLNLPNLPQPPTIPSLPQARQSVVIDDQDENKQLLESILVSTRAMNNNSDAQQNTNQSQHQQPVSLPQSPKPIQNRPLTFHEELSLKLKLGKDYKPPARVIESSKPEPKQQPKRQPQPSFERTNSFRQSTKIQDIIGVASKPAPKQTNNAMFADDDEEQQNALFGSGKRKPTSQTQTQNSKFGISKNQADAMMSRSTFNEDTLFKKKPIFSKETVLPTKTQEKPKQKEQKKPNRASVLFNQDSDEQADFTFKKKTSKKPQEKKPQQQSPKKKPEQKKSNPLGFGEKPQVKEKTVQQPKKKNINKLFGGDSDEEGDIFAKKKPMSKKQSETTSKPVETQAQKVVQKPFQKVSQKPSNPLVQPKTQKKNSLFNDDEQEDDFAFKPKVKPAVKKESKKEEMKPSLFQDKEDDDSVFKPKPKPGKKQLEKETIQSEVVKPKPQSPQKSKGPLSSSIPQQKNEEGSGIFLAKKSVQTKSEPIIKVQQPSQPAQDEESEEAKRMKRIARMGGQPMMGMAQMIPKGMHITKPSETKQNQKIARQHIQHERSKLAHIHEVKDIEPKRQLDPLEKLIKQTIKVEELVKEVKPQIIEQKRELDPLEKLINIRMSKTTEQQLPIVSEIKPIPQPKPAEIKEEKPIQANNVPEVTLEVRRKKNKPKRNDDDFFDDQEKPKQVKKLLTVPVKEIKQEKPQTPKQVKKNPLIFSPSQQKSQKSSQIDKIAKMSMAGMPQMGMGQLMMPKGLIITKPSQAKKLQQQALQRMKLEEEERAKRHQQEQRERQNQRQIKQQQQLLKAQQQQQLRLQEIANQTLRQQQEERQTRQKQIRQKQQNERQQRLLYEQEERQRIVYEEAMRHQQEVERQRQVEEQQRKRIEEEKERLRRAEEEQLKKQKSSLPSLTPFESGPKKQSNPFGAKTKQSGPLDVPKLPPKVNPLGGSSTKSPLGGPLGNSLGSQKATGLSSGNSGLISTVPAINRDAPKNTGKKSLFDDDQDDSFAKKKDTNYPKTSFSNANEKKKPSLFGDDDEDSGLGFGSKAKPKKNTTSKKGLFDEDDDEGFGFGKKTKKSETKEPIIQSPIIETKQQPKPVSQKLNLFNNDSDDDNGMIGKKKPQSNEPIKPTLIPQKAPQEIRIPQPTLAEKPKNKKPMFGGDDSDSDGGFGKKKVDKKPLQPPASTTNNLTQNQPKTVPNPQKEVKSKRGLFGSSDEQEVIRKPAKPTVVKQTPLPVTSKPTQAKKGLFGGSDDEEDDVFKKNVPKKPEPINPINNPVQKEPMIPTKKAQMTSTSPLTTSKSSNPLGLSSGPLQAKTFPLKQPVTQTSQPQQKKRNILQESDEQPSPSQKSKPVQQPAQKKGLVVQDSQEQKPQVREQKQNVAKQIEPQVSPPVQANHNNRRLFDDSEQDSDAEQMMRKKRMANSKLKKLF